MPFQLAQRSRVVGQDDRDAAIKLHPADFLYQDAEGFVKEAGRQGICAIEIDFYGVVLFQRGLEEALTEFLARAGAVLAVAPARTIGEVGDELDLFQR